MTINLADIGCDVADEEVSEEINCVTRKVIPRSNLTANIHVEKQDPQASPFEIKVKSPRFDFETSKQKFEVQK